MGIIVPTTGTAGPSRPNLGRTGAVPGELSVHDVRRLARPLVAGLSVLLLMLGGTSAGAAPADTPATAPTAVASCGPGRTVPANLVSVQLYTFAEYVGFGTDATLARLHRVLGELRDIGYRNVEPFTFNGLTATEFKNLLRRYGLRAVSRHGSTDEARWDAELADSRTLLQRYTGSGGSAAPGLGSMADVRTTAATLNRPGERSLRHGTGKVVVHNHRPEFINVYTDPITGATMSAWEQDPVFFGEVDDMLDEARTSFEYLDCRRS